MNEGNATSRVMTKSKYNQASYNLHLDVYILNLIELFASLAGGGQGGTAGNIANP
jgi:hypothetical protein